MIRPGANRILAPLLVLLAVLSGCDKPEQEPPDPAERAAEAEALYSTALFDTVDWPDSRTRISAGNLVYTDACRRCHGTLGEGGTDYARERGLDVPSLVEESWPHAGDIEAVRRRTFTGHPAGMPIFGVHRLTPRQLDAVAAYVVQQLRPEVLGR